MNLFSKKKENPIMQIPPIEEIADKMSREAPNLVDCEIIRVIYSKDKTKRFILFKSMRGFYKYTYEEICVLDEEEWKMCCLLDENAYPAYWATMDTFCGNSFFGTEEEAFSAMKQETEYLQYFK